MEPDEIEYLLNAFNIGTSTAENDLLLPEAQIRTQEFYDIYDQDRIDLVRGSKGAGKTALYKVLHSLRDYAFEEDQANKIMVFGVEIEGDPVFKGYTRRFDEFNEQDFEKFWYCYFIYLAIGGIVERKDSLPVEAVQALDQIIR